MKNIIKLFSVCFVIILCLPIHLVKAAEISANPPQEVPVTVSAGAYVVMDIKTGQVLLGENIHEIQYPASITKILTMALVLENVDYEAQKHTLITTSQSAVDALMPNASMIALQVGEEMTLEDLLYATHIESANDAAHVLAEYVAGSMEAFAEMMNAKVQELGLENSNFVNSSGQPDDAHYVSAYDMAMITRWAMSVPGFRELWASTQHDMAPTNKRGARTLYGDNLVVRQGSSYYVPGVTGSKTGYTDQAKSTLVTSASQGESELVCVILSGASSAAKFRATEELMAYCFTNFHKAEISLASMQTTMVPVYGGGANPLGEIEVYAKESTEIWLHSGVSADIVETMVQIPQQYIMGDVFAPNIALILPQDVSVQYSGVIYEMPLPYTGLEEILAGNTYDQNFLQSMAREDPVLFWLLLAMPLAGAAAFVARKIYVQRKHEKRRMKRLAAARAVTPIRIAKRPEPPQRGNETAKRKPSTPHRRGVVRSAEKKRYPNSRR